MVEHSWTHEKKLTGIQAFLIHRNVAPSKNWLAIQLVGTAGTSPIGSKVTLRGSFGSNERHIVTGDSFFAQHPTVAHFGLGDYMAKDVERVSITWPDGRVSTSKVEGVNRYLRLRAPTE